jgi:hypothetical protein
MASADLSPRAGSGGYEFTPAQNDLIGGLASKMKLVGLVLVIFGVLNLLNAVLVQVMFAQLTSDKVPAEVKEQFGQLGQRERWIFTGYFAIAGLVLLAVGVWTRSAGGSFQNIVATAGRDIGHLMDGLGSLAKMYSLIATVIVAAILAYLVLIVVKLAQGQSV